MKAIVLTCDKYVALAKHMIFQYNKLWPDHPFRFRIPYQELKGKDCHKYEYIKTPLSIKATVLRLLEDLSDEEWIYWCIDDKYPISLDLQRIRNLVEWISNFHNEDISGISFCHDKRLKSKDLTGRSIRDNEGNVYFELNKYKRIWKHQFVQVKVIRYMFENFPDVISPPKAMDEFKRSVKLPDRHRLFTSKDNLAVFGESTSRGFLTENCYKSIIRNRLTLPEWFSTTNGKTMITGKLKNKRKKHLLITKYIKGLFDYAR